MKIYAEEYNWQNDTKLVEVRLFGLDGEWFEDYENGGSFHQELFTSYRAATEWLLSEGYEMFIDWWDLRKGIQELTFERKIGTWNETIKIEEMEVVK